jgi:hypothetical protein
MANCKRLGPTTYLPKNLHNLHNLQGYYNLQYLSLLTLPTQPTQLLAFLVLAEHDSDHRPARRRHLERLRWYSSGHALVFV